MENIRVVVRVRPFLPDEEPRSCVVVRDHQISVGDDRHFAFDHVFDMETTSKVVNDKISAPLADAFVNGYTVSTIAYGQTGAGKTFTMSSLSSDVVRRVSAALKASAPVEGGERPEFFFSAVEVYNEQVSDLIGSTTSSAVPLILREDAHNGVYIKGLSEVAVNSDEELLAWIDFSLANRCTASTLVNATSSRSHCLLTVTLKYNGVVSRLGLVDLAGSERFKKVYNGRFVAKNTGDAESERHTITNNGKAKAAMLASRMREGISINSGLLALGNVITSLCKRRPYIPYRTSKLTRLLQPMLGGNSKTTIIACVSPTEVSFEETLNTLKYADRAKSICTTPFKTSSNLVFLEDAGATILYFREQLAVAQQQLKKQQGPTGLSLPVIDQAQINEFEKLIECERRLTQRLQEDLFNAEYTTMIEVEKRKVLEKRVKELEAAQCVKLEKTDSDVLPLSSNDTILGNNVPSVEVEAERDDLHAVACLENCDAVSLTDTVEDFTVASSSCKNDERKHLIKRLVQQREDALRALKCSEELHEEMQKGMHMLEEKLARANAKLEVAENDIEKKEEVRRRAEAHYKLQPRKAEENAAKWRHKPKEAFPVGTRETGGESVTKQLQTRVLEMSEELNRQRHAALEVQKRLQKVTALHAEESRLLQRQLREANARAAKLQVQLQRKERELALAKKNIGSNAAASCSCECQKQRYQEHQSHLVLPASAQSLSLSSDVQNEINSELQALTDLEIAVGIFKHNRDELISILNKAQGGPETASKWTRAREGFTMRLEHLEEVLQSYDLSEEVRLQYVREKSNIEEKLQQLQAVEPVLSDAVKQLSELNDAIDSLQEARKYRLRRVRGLQRGDSTLPVESVITSGLLNSRCFSANLQETTKASK